MGLCSNNSLTGSLPQEWSQLAQLVDLRAAANNLTGSLPASYSSLANLTAVRLWSNSLSGELQRVTFSRCLHEDAARVLRQSDTVNVGGVWCWVGMPSCLQLVPRSCNSPDSVISAPPLCIAFPYRCCFSVQPQRWRRCAPPATERANCHVPVASHLHALGPS